MTLTPLEIAKLLKFTFDRGSKDGETPDFIQKESRRSVAPDTEISLILCKDGKVIVCTQGTEPTSFLDVITDITFRRDPHPVSNSFGRVHAGFLSAAQGVGWALLGWLRDRGIQTKSILFAGHSMGGAVSVIMPSLVFSGMSLMRESIFAIGIATPNVGTSEFVNACGRTFPKGNITSHIISRDPVPWSWTGLKRPGTDIVYKKPEGVLLSHPLVSYIKAMENAQTKAVA